MNETATVGSVAIINPHSVLGRAPTTVRISTDHLVVEFHGDSRVHRAAVRNRAWLGVRQAIDFAHAAGLFPCRIRIAWGRRLANAKHALDLAALGAPPGAKLLLTAQGPRAEEAILGLSRLIEAGFQLELCAGD